MQKTGNRLQLGIQRETKALRRAPPERGQPTPPEHVRGAARQRRAGGNERHCPACQTALVGISDTATPSDLVRRGILLIGIAECGTCGQGWIFADCSPDADRRAVRVDLARISSCVLSMAGDRHDG